MPIEHVVLFNLPGATEEEWEEIKKVALALPSKIPGLLKLTIGKNISPARAGVYTYGLSSTFADEPSLRAYGPHDEHQALVKKLSAHWKDVVVVDWEI